MVKKAVTIISTSITNTNISHALCFMKTYKDFFNSWFGGNQGATPFAPSITAFDKFLLACMHYYLLLCGVKFRLPLLF